MRSLMLDLRNEGCSKLNEDNLLSKAVQNDTLELLLRNWNPTCYFKSAWYITNFCT